MFTGAVPFTGQTFLEVLNRHLNEPAPSMSAVFPELQISPELQAVIMHGLAKDPARRFQSMNEFSHALLATPEGSGFSRHSVAPGQLSEIGGYGSVMPGSPTAAQFAKPSTLGPSVQSFPGGGVPAPGHDSQPAGTPAPRTETQAATANTVVGQRGSGVGLALALGGSLLVVAAGAAAFFLLREPLVKAEKPAPGASTAAVAAAPPSAALVPVALPAPTPEPSASAATVTPASTVQLDVVTEPAGATLFKDGFQVCDTTPCEVAADLNETLTLEAKKGAQKGTIKVLAQRDQKVSIKLSGGARPAAPARPRMCEVEVDGLKILRPCR